MAWWLIHFPSVDELVSTAAKSLQKAMDLMNVDGLVAQAKL